MWQCLFAIVIILWVLHVICNYNERARLVKKIPGPKEAFIIGNALTIIRSRVDIMHMRREFAKTWNGIWRLWIPPFGSVILYNPEDIEVVTSSLKYIEKSTKYKFIKPWLRDGLLLSKGIKWQERRKILTPAFHFNILRQFCEVIVENSQRLAETLARTAGQQIDVAPVLSEYTLNTICETAMGTQLSKDNTGAGKTYKNAIYELGSLIFERVVRVYLYPDFIFNLTSIGRKQNIHLKTIHDFTGNVIKQRKEYDAKHGVSFIEQNEDLDETYVYKKKKKTAMLDLLISAEKEGLINKEGIQEEVDTFMFEGHDTTASGLTFCLMVLANHKNIQDKIVAEQQEIFGDSDRPVSMEDLPKMRYLECCIKESLRMYPPIHFISRNLSETTTLSSYTIPAGIHCNIDIFELHHRADLFPNPEQFDPDRFLPENCAGRHPYAYIPFSAGPRNCIGQKFAMMEMKITVAQVLRQFELEPVTKPADIEFITDLVLRNNGPVHVKFVKRKQ